MLIVHLSPEMYSSPLYRPNRFDRISAPFHRPPLRTTGLERVVSCEEMSENPVCVIDQNTQRPFRRMICRPLYHSNPGPAVDLNYTRVLGSNLTELLVALSARANRLDYDKSKRVLRENNPFFLICNM